MSLGFVFPGQGAQAVGMGGEFLDSDPAGSGSTRPTRRSVSTWSP